MPADVLQNYNEATVTTTLNGTDAAGTVEAITVSAVLSAWVGLTSGVTQLRVMDKADLALTSGYEIMILTANNGGAAGGWSLTRGAEGSTVHSHTANWTLVPAYTAAGLQNLALPGVELGRAEITGNVNISLWTSFTVISGLSVPAYIPAGVDVRVELDIPWISWGTTSTYIVVQIYEDTTALRAAIQGVSANSNAKVGIGVDYTPSSVGNHTYTVQALLGAQNSTTTIEAGVQAGWNINPQLRVSVV